MKVKVVVQLFGPLVEQAGTSRIEILAPTNTVRGVVAAVERALPSLRVDASIRYAVNAEYAGADREVCEGDTVSLLPPVGGG